MLDPENTATVEETSILSPSLIALLQPIWLKYGYVGSDNCISAARKQERSVVTDTVDESQSSIIDQGSQVHTETDSMGANDSSQSSGKQKVSRSGPITKDEISTEAATMVYKIITSLLQKSRYASKIQLYHD